MEMRRHIPWRRNIANLSDLHFLLSKQTQTVNFFFIHKKDIKEQNENGII